MQRENPTELNLARLQMPKWNVPTDRVQIVDKKSGVIRLAIMFTQENHLVALTCCGHIFTIFMLPSAENRKKRHFNILITITLEVNMITQQMEPFFHLLFELLSVGLFHLCIPKYLQNSISSVPYLHYVLVCKIHIYWPMMTLWSLFT